MIKLFLFSNFQPIFVIFKKVNLIYFLKYGIDWKLEEEKNGKS